MINQITNTVECRIATKRKWEKSQYKSNGINLKEL